MVVAKLAWAVAACGIFLIVLMVQGFRGMIRHDYASPRYARSYLMAFTGINGFGLLLILAAAALLLLSACADPNAGKFPPGKQALLLGLREGLELGIHVP